MLATFSAEYFVFFFLW